MQPQNNVLEKPPRATSLLEFLSPFGVISNREFVYRLLTVVGFIFISVMLFAFIPDIIASLEEIGQQSVASMMYPGAGVLGFLLFWFLLATLTKEYRTSGMPIPFVFALLTYILPFFFIIRFLLSSKTKRAVNKERAEQQAEYRNSEKIRLKNRKRVDAD